MSAGDPAMAGKVAEYGGYATSIFMIGWAIGGLVFGILGDKIGRAKTMMLTILLYSVFTGLSALSVGVWDFAFYRFLTGLGVGGEFAVGVALVAEVMPDRARTSALGWLQALSAVGNMMAALISIGLGELEERGPSAAPGGPCSSSGCSPPCSSSSSSASSRSPSAGRRPPRPRRRWATPRASTSSARCPSCSATRDGGGTRSSACSWPSPGSSASGGSASSAST